MYKVFKLNKNDKIEFTKDELKSLLDEVYREGGKDNSDKYYHWIPPYDWPNWIYCSTGSIVANNNGSHTVSIKPASATTATSTIATSSTSGDTSIINYKDLMNENKTTVRYGDN